MKELTYESDELRGLFIAGIMMMMTGQREMIAVVCRVSCCGFSKEVLAFFFARGNKYKIIDSRRIL